MNLGNIRRGLVEVLTGIDGITVLPEWPISPPWGSNTVVVVLPDDPYVTYSEGAGRTNKNVVLMRLVCLPLPSKQAVRIQAELDDLLSCGPTEPRSLRTRLGTDLSVDGTACTVSVLSASIKTFQVGEVEAVGAEVSLKILARC